MTWKNRLVRLSRALTGATQSEFADAAGVDRAMLAHYELGRCEPGPEHLKNLTQAAGLTVPAGQQILDYADALRHPRQQAGQGIEHLNADLNALVSRVYQRLLRLPHPGDPPGPEDRERAEEQWAILEKLSDEQRLALVRLARELQNPALAEEADATDSASSGDLVSSNPSRAD